MDTFATTLPVSPQVWSSELGEFISEDHRRLAEVLHDYYPGRYSLSYLPARDRTTIEEHNAPFMIAERQGGAWQPVRYLSEDEMKKPAHVLAWIFEGDLTKHKPGDVLARIEAREAAQRLMELKRREDELADMREKAAFLVSGGREKKHTVRLGGGRTLER